MLLVWRSQMSSQFKMFPCCSCEQNMTLCLPNGCICSKIAICLFCRLDQSARCFLSACSCCYASFCSDGSSRDVSYPSILDSWSVVWRNKKAYASPPAPVKMTNITPLISRTAVRTAPQSSQSLHINQEFWRGHQIDIRRAQNGSTAKVGKLYEQELWSNMPWYKSSCCVCATWRLSHPSCLLSAPPPPPWSCPRPAPVLTWTSEPGGGGALGIGDWGTGRVVTEGLGWSSDWGCWRTWLWWARQHPMASVRSGPWWPPQLLSSYQSGWSPHLGSHLRGQQITNKQGPLLLYGV